jgi:hypothetical protein
VLLAAGAVGLVTRTVVESDGGDWPAWLTVELLPVIASGTGLLRAWGTMRTGHGW